MPTGDDAIGTALSAPDHRGAVLSITNIIFDLDGP